MEDPIDELADAIAQLKNATAKRHAVPRGTPEHDDIITEEERPRARLMSLADALARFWADALTAASHSGKGSGGIPGILALGHRVIVRRA